MTGHSNEEKPEEQSVLQGKFTLDSMATDPTPQKRRPEEQKEDLKQTYKRERKPKPEEIPEENKQDNIPLGDRLESIELQIKQSLQEYDKLVDVVEKLKIINILLYKEVCREYVLFNSKPIGEGSSATGMGAPEKHSPSDQNTKRSIHTLPGIPNRAPTKEI
ncbi:hypothetical protein NEOKW01_0483 [Nematocida sp. AWRm80]|nr:hypothetical protein NEOKW01_0483 [Nematocida sp. AWRm80]